MRDPSAQVEVRTRPAARSRLRARCNQMVTWIAAVLLCVAATAYVGVARAQSPQPVLVVMPVIQVKSLGQVPFVIVAGPPEALPPNSLIRIWGLPAGVTPSESQRGATGSWDVPLSAAHRLKLHVTDGLSRRLDFVVTLVDAKGTVLAESPSALVVEVVAGGSAQAIETKEPAKLDERRRADEAREAERRKAEEVRLAAVVRRAEEMRLEVEKVEAALKAEEARKLAEAEAEAARKVEEAEQLARAEEAWKVAEAKKVDDERKVAEAKQAKIAEDQARQLAAEAERLARAEEARKAAETKRVEDERKAAEANQAKVAEEHGRKLAAEAERLEVRKAAEAKRVEDERKAAEAKQARMAEEADKLARNEEARKGAEANDEKTRTIESEVPQISSSLTETPGTTGSTLPDQQHTLAPTASNATAPATMAQPTQSERLFNRGERYRRDGNIVVARQYLLRAAQMGLAQAAFKLAETYDPNVHDHLSVNADLAEAKRWYARAVELGAEDAKARLARLGQE